MRRIREGLRLSAVFGRNISAIARDVQMSRSTVREYLQKASSAGINFQVAAGMADEALEAALFPPVDRF